MTNMEKAVHEMVEDVSSMCGREGSREYVAKIAYQRLNKEKNINCARDDTKAHDYLCEALDIHCPV